MILSFDRSVTFISINIRYKYCAGKCQRQWLISGFADNELSRQDGICIRCTAQKENHPGLNKLQQCYSCKKKKKKECYSPVVLRLLLGTSRGFSVRKGISCEECQYPLCANKECRANRPHALTIPPHTAYKDGKWFCDTCAGVFCAGCGKKLDRIHWRKKIPGKEWHCQECKSTRGGISALLKLRSKDGKSTASSSASASGKMSRDDIGGALPTIPS